MIEDTHYVTMEEYFGMPDGRRLLLCPADIDEERFGYVSVLEGPAGRNNHGGLTMATICDLVMEVLTYLQYHPRVTGLISLSWTVAGLILLTTGLTQPGDDR